MRVKAGVEQSERDAAGREPRVGMETQRSWQGAESGFGIKRPGRLHLLVERSVAFFEQGLKQMLLDTGGASPVFALPVRIPVGFGENQRLGGALAN